MNDKPKFNPNTHNRRSIRLKGYDYSQAGLYFITICCYEREHLFGEIVEPGKMQLNEAGKIADECWLGIRVHFPNAVLHEHIIMPNHIHGIIELMNDSHFVGTEEVIPMAGNENIVPNVRAENFLPLQRQNAFHKMIPRSIGSIVKGFKIGVTKWFRKNTTIQTVWQRNYYEHIIRNEQLYQFISDYIINNPMKWKDDKFYTE